MFKWLQKSGLAMETMSWSLERYHKAIASGVLVEHDKVELIFGKLITAPPKEVEHAGTIEVLQEFFRELLGREYRYRSESPLPLPPDSEPEPDFLIAKRTPKGMKSRHPLVTETHLVIEVAFSTLEFDRTVKGPLYASAGVAEYWIINLRGRKIEVYQSPSTDDGTWKNSQIVDAGDTFESPFAGSIQVNDLLPIIGE
ncbi:Uma2 family endonuclease [Lewinella sp. 4G2]|uniref:Uma2 family endonuclease n=1 Tax=Lewinella sp. 4G2 TaxID=1803372 RepID=UPI0007B45EC1|nr:Uma2 family endonuclease [Lewinella sp. 4G2]OAV43851.1 hypothetical protein A3850_004765 [Lewinella sp. 4G2]